MHNLDIKNLWNRIRFRSNTVTAILIYACIVTWLIEIFLYFVTKETYITFIEYTAFVPVTALNTPWTWFTSMFVHAPNITHIFFNMLCLWSLGAELERYFGRWKFFGLYLISGLGGCIADIIWCRIINNWQSASYGASGAIMGLIGALLVAQWRLGENMRGTIIWIAITLAMPIIIPNIAWQAHVGGLIIGTALAALLGVQNPLLRKASFNTRFLTYFISIFIILVACAVFCLQGLA
ncbi:MULTISPECIES: rhomboid family intramembrane serine protease [Gardnerella]|uniref:rhomboid family intramembrane serine protease n=1 Tax=Gardnerella TaxID=2701 RepID=UPI00026351A3|nr:rhomboid family intramembrane serine protease [Gardnerella vaginalis]EIK87574.1 rhomboid family membrane protein [Gardnerella vaginalis 6119V5]MBF9308273.1 rhomboid family intramembrane serine protease [Bifidobacteriaceae bacterium NR043]MBF9354022.1 rhomboid family intramembrane serine protease [Bifidobacteriaceae bacterium NR044]RIY17400.1 rhomboid family intramembrane serine protease [Bifidobacteriaceae bacterium WP012]